MKPTTSGNTALAFALTLAFGTPVIAPAQSTATPPPNNGTTTENSSPSGQDSDVVILNTFVVNTEKDTGYVAVDSLAGGRQNTPVRVTPAAVSSLTNEVLSDLAITDVQDALQWSLNVVPTSFRNGMNGGSGGDVFNYWSVSIRGDNHVQGGNPPTKNYFPTFMPIDVYNIDRLEVDGGPNSILFGIGDIGGSLTSYTKHAVFGNDISRLTFRTSNWGGYRVMTDINRPVTEKWAVRLNAVVANDKGWIKGDNNKKLGVDLATTYKLSNDAQIRFDIEGWTQKKSIFASSIQDNASLWDGTTSAATWGAAVAGIDQNPLNTPGAPGVKAMGEWGGPEHFLVWTPSVGLYNWGGGVRAMGTNDVMWGAYLRSDAYAFGPSNTTVPALPSRDFAVAPTDALLKPKALDATLSFEQRINSNSEFQIAAYYYTDSSKAKNFEGGNRMEVDLNEQLPDGSPNPNFGKKFSDFFLDEQVQDHRVNEIRGQYSYHFDTEIGGVPLKQSFSVSAGHQVTDLITRQHQAAVMDDTFQWTGDNWTQHMLWGRVYWDHPRALHVPNSYNGADIEYIALPFNWYDWNIKQKIDYVGAFSQTRLWDDRLSVSLGARHDAYDNSKIDVRGTNNSFSKDSGNTYTAGLVGYVTPWLGLVGNLSENFQPAAGGLAPSLYGETFGPSFGKGRSVGVRISTQDNKYWVSANYYDDKSTDVTGGSKPDFQAIWNDYFKAGGTNTDIGPAGNVVGSGTTAHANMLYEDTYDVRYTGMEFEATINPTKNFRLLAHYAVPKGKTENAAPNSMRYFQEHLATWQAAAGGTSPESTTLASDLTKAGDTLDAVSEPAVTAHLAKKIYNLFGVYSFDEGALNGWEFGAGITGLGKQYGNPGDKINGERVLSPAYSTWSMLIGYSTKFNTMNRDVAANFQLNVDNVFDNDKLVFLSYQAYGDGLTQPMDFRYLAPRQVTLTATFSF